MKKVKVSVGDGLNLHTTSSTIRAWTLWTQLPLLRGAPPWDHIYVHYQPGSALKDRHCLTSATTRVLMCFLEGFHLKVLSFKFTFSLCIISARTKDWVQEVVVSKKWLGPDQFFAVPISYPICINRNGNYVQNFVEDTRIAKHSLFAN